MVKMKIDKINNNIVHLDYEKNVEFENFKQFYSIYKKPWPMSIRFSISVRNFGTLFSET